MTHSFIIVSTIEDDLGEESWNAFPMAREKAAEAQFAAEQAETCTCDIHRWWAGPRMERIALPDTTDPRVGITVDGLPVHVVRQGEFTWHDQPEEWARISGVQSTEGGQ